MIDVIRELADFGCQVDVADPWADPREVQDEYGVNLVATSELDALEPSKAYDAVVLAVAHDSFQSMDYSRLKTPDGVLFDIKACLDRNLVDGRL